MTGIGKKTCNLHLDKRESIAMKSTNFKIEDVFVEALGNGGFSLEQRTESNKFFSQNHLKISSIINVYFFQTLKKNLYGLSTLSTHSKFKIFSS